MAVSALSLSSVCKASVFSEFNPVPHISGDINLSHGKYLWQSKIEKKSSIRFWATSVSVLKYVHIYVTFGKNS